MKSMKSAKQSSGLKVGLDAAKKISHGAKPPSSAKKSK
jgi:hypothetical protein